MKTKQKLDIATKIKLETPDDYSAQELGNFNIIYFKTKKIFPLIPPKQKYVTNFRMSKTKLIFLF